MDKKDFVDDVYHWKKLLTNDSIDGDEHRDTVIKFMRWLRDLRDMVETNQLPKGVDKDIVEGVLNAWTQGQDNRADFEETFQQITKVIAPLEETKIDDELSEYKKAKFEKMFNLGQRKPSEKENTDKGNPFADLRNQVGKTQQKEETSEIKRNDQEQQQKTQERKRKIGNYLRGKLMVDILPKDRQRNAINEFYIQNLEDEINNLAILVTDNGNFDQRFDMAVAKFQLFLDNAEKNNLPQDLAKMLREKQYVNYGNQQSYVSDLLRVYKNYCKNKSNKMVIENHILNR